MQEQHTQEGRQEGNGVSDDPEIAKFLSLRFRPKIPNIKPVMLFGNGKQKMTTHTGGQGNYRIERFSGDKTEAMNTALIPSAMIAKTNDAIPSPDLRSDFVPFASDPFPSFTNRSSV